MSCLYVGDKKIQPSKTNSGSKFMVIPRPPKPTAGIDGSLGSNKQPLCVPGNSTITVLGKLSKLVKNGSYLVKSAAHNNLPSGVVVNHSNAASKAGQVAVILINTTSRNIWICQPLLAAKIYEVELHP